MSIAILAALGAFFIFPAFTRAGFGPPLVRGDVFGEWQLPADLETPGYLSGYLFTEDTFDPFFGIQATIIELPIPGIPFRGGLIEGDLYPPSDPSQPTRFHVRGTWSGPRSANYGTWQADIYIGDSRIANDHLEGVYYDPGDGDGVFAGSFVFELVP
jgi:hypothetical protein